MACQTTFRGIDVNELIEQSANESAQQSAKTIKDAIEQASDVAAGIVIKHRIVTPPERGKLQTKHQGANPLLHDSLATIAFPVDQLPP